VQPDVNRLGSPLGHAGKRRRPDRRDTEAGQAGTDPAELAVAEEQRQHARPVGARVDVEARGPGRAARRHHPVLAEQRVLVEQPRAGRAGAAASRRARRRGLPSASPCRASGASRARPDRRRSGRRSGSVRRASARPRPARARRPRAIGASACARATSASACAPPSSRGSHAPPRRYGSNGSFRSPSDPAVLSPTAQALDRRAQRGCRRGTLVREPVELRGTLARTPRSLLRFRAGSPAAQTEASSCGCGRGARPRSAAQRRSHRPTVRS
jgi:hypothetical protein